MQMAPLSVPLERRLQTAVVAAHVFNVTMAPPLFAMLLGYLLTTSLWWFTVGYLAWIAYDARIARTHRRGGRRSEWLRRARHMDFYRDYFPLQLHKTAELDPGKNYILCCHPHGVLSAAAFCNFASEATGFGEKFPGITSYLLTLEMNVMWPLVRAYALWMGMCDVSKESISWILTRQGKGNACVVVVGGAAEALDARPGSFRLTLLARKGFIKIALTTGSALVPVYSFGENDLYLQANNPKGSFVRTFQETFKNISGFSPPLFYGRGIFNYTFGFLPHRRPVNTVVGAPIDVPLLTSPTDEDIETYHRLYVEALNKLFNDHKTRFGIDEDTYLTLV